eukprot:793235-Prorocentrum_minimum.AAC.1
MRVSLEGHLPALPRRGSGPTHKSPRLPSAWAASCRRMCRRCERVNWRGGVKTTREATSARRAGSCYTR